MTNNSLNKNISLPNGLTEIIHSKASEKYIAVQFKFANHTWQGWVPIEYRRTGTHLEDKVDIVKHLNAVYDQMKENRYSIWLSDQQQYWEKEKPTAYTTKSFFDKLAQGGWKCVKCQLPNNPNWARRVQDLKEYGYTLATDTRKYCNSCQKNTTHLILLPIRRGGLTGNGYETWSSSLRKRILTVLNNVDVYENKINYHSLPDHKFPEIRWDNETKSVNPETMSDSEIRAKFQLLSNQRNQQKREVCRNCYQTGNRGIIYGIPFFYEGNHKWDNKKYPTVGKKAEQGCVGCAWYDIAKWRSELIKLIED